MKYTQEFCEREYNVRARVPEHPAILSRWAMQGAATRRLHACLLDLPYGDSPGERLDIFPAREEPSPLLIFIHGGFWRALDKSDFSWIAPSFVNHGVSVALLKSPWPVCAIAKAPSASAEFGFPLRTSCAAFAPDA